VKAFKRSWEIVEKKTHKDDLPKRKEHFDELMKNKDDFFIELYDEFVDDNLSSIYDW
jgi:hypothetical protein